MCDSTSISTPVLLSSKKRDLSSPDDQLNAKKNRTIQFSPDLNTCTKFTMDSSPSSEPPTHISLDDAAIKSIALALKDSIHDELMSMLKSTVESVVKGVLDELHTQISSLKTQNEALRSENNDLMYRVDILEFRSDAAEQYSRRDNVRISGLVEKEGEHTDDEVISIAKSVGLTLSTNDISISHRVGKKKPNSKPRDIIVKFVSRRSRDSFYKKRSALKSSGHSGIYVNEDLTKYRAELLFNARQMVNSKKIAGAWSSDGIVLVKALKDNKTSIHRIFCKRDLEQFMTYSVM